MDERLGALSPFGVKTLGFTVHDLPPEAQQFLRDRGTVRRYRRGEEVARRELPSQHASWVLEGRLRCVGRHADGSEFHGGWVMVHELFAVSSVLLDVPSRVTLVVDTPEVSLLHFSADDLREVVLTMPEGGIGVAVGLAKRLNQQYDMIDVVGQRTLANKLRAVLMWWSRHHGIPARDGSVELWVGQNELAVGVGGSRQRVHTELQNLRDLGQLDLGYRKLILRPSFFAPRDPAPKDDDESI